MKAKNKLLTLLTLSVGATACTAVINKCIKVSATSRNSLCGPRSLCYKWRFGNIHYTKSGTGKPLLLIHDLSAFSCGYEWVQVVNHLSERYTVYTIDLLGCGRSEKPDLTYTNFLFVQLLSDFIKSEIGHRTNIMATGASSALAIMACNQTPDLFDHLMLISPDSLMACNQIPNKHARFYKLILDLPIIGTLLYNIASNKQVIMEEFTAHYYSNPYTVKSTHIDAYHQAAHLGESPKSLFASVRCNYTKCNIVNALRKIDHSIYIVTGKAQNSAKQTIQEYQDCNPAIEYSIISDSKYLPQLENPAELLKVIQMFFG